MYQFIIAKLLSPRGLSALAAIAAVFVPEVGSHAQEAAQVVAGAAPATSGEAGAYVALAATAVGWALERKAGKHADRQP